VLLGLLVVVNVFTYRQAADMIHHPPEERQPIDETPADYDLPFEEITLSSEDGMDLAAWYVPSQNGAAIIAQHGYKSNRTEMLNRAAFLHAAGYGVLMIDLRSHGESEGETVTFGYTETRDLQAAYDYLLTRPDVEPERIGGLGNSLGATITLLHAADNPGIAAVVADSPFASVRDTIEVSVEFFTGLPPFPFAYLMLFWGEQQMGVDSDDYAAARVIGQISPRPVFILSGGADNVVSPEGGQALYAAAGEPRELWYDPAVGHVGFYDAYPQEYEERVLAFFSEYLGEG
jgi:fermentation-respiration switch protein FrsA (DUF1100 family)